ncbi:RidA family protein, partial [Neomegalonema sp.]|uniref:RidA family protein n=1 Tax=Neomegalonema sp. TaxID=2039713 RepID=UPI002615B41E
MSVDARLAELGLTLPSASAPAANYVPFVISGNLVFVSGQLPMSNGALTIKGLVGAEVSVEQAREAAKLCALNLLAQVKAALGGDLSRLKRVVKLTGFVASGPDFTQHPEVVNGASDVLVEILGDAGRHARAAVGAPSLPRGTPV